MSDIKAVSPLTDGFEIGAPMDSRFGAVCCPAIHTATKEKFILKRISIPESPDKIEALLLTGACSNEGDVREYYQNVARELRQELEIQQQMAQSSGFAPFYGYQIEQKESGIGYDVYILSAFQVTLAAYAKKNALTHLNAVNLGIDLASALSDCHQAGYLYQDLKPENIFMNSQRQFRIGDLGFVSLESLDFATFPDKYLGPCAAPEVRDFMGSLNPTIDIYALGMVLYWVYNDYKYPFEDAGGAEAAEKRRLSGEAFPAPVYADYELAEIILKACAFKPEDRWLSPAEMGQALISYMQRNAVNDSLIGPPVLEEKEEEEETPAEEADQQEAAKPQEEIDESAPGEEDVDEAIASRNPETADILEKANQFIAEAEPKKEPEPEAASEEKLEPPAVPPALEQTPQKETREEKKARKVRERAEAKADRKARKEAELLNGKEKKTAWLPACIILFVIAAVAVASYFVYAYYYCIPVSNLRITADQSDGIRVTFDTKAEDKDIVAVCTNTYGTTRSAIPQNGSVVFDGLTPGTQYTITLRIDGFHKLTGDTIASYTTENVAKVVSMSAVAGSEDGSVILSFTPDGPESESWIVMYNEEGAEDQQQKTTITGHSGMITGLTVGKTYVFRLADKNGYTLLGENQLSFTVTPLLLAQNLRLTDCTGTSLTAVWEQPETHVDRWNVRCYCPESDYSVMQEVAGCTATFHDLDPACGYVVEVTAIGMTKAVNASISANPLTVTSHSCAINEQGELAVSWEFEGAAPSGWLVTYTTSDAPDAPVSQTVTENSFAVSPALPGVSYSFSLQTTDNSTVSGGSFTFEGQEAEDFTDFNVSPNAMSLFLMETPTNEGWQSRWINVSSQTEFTTAQDLSFVLMAPTSYWGGSQAYTAAYVLKDGTGKVIHTATEEVNWESMWQQRHFTGSVPHITEPGEYTLEIYLNYQFVKGCTFTLADPEV